MILGLCIYVLCSSVGLILIKYGVSKKLELSFVNQELKLSLNYIAVIGLILYIISFLLSLFLMKNLSLNYFYPVSAGAIFVFVCILGVVVLNEKVSVLQSIGSGIILLGIIIMNLK